VDHLLRSEKAIHEITRNNTNEGQGTTKYQVLSKSTKPKAQTKGDVYSDV